MKATSHTSPQVRHRARGESVGGQEQRTLHEPAGQSGSKLHALQPLCIAMMAMMMAGGIARAASDTNFTVHVNQTIPDANVNGLSSSFTLGDMERSVGAIRVSLNVTGGANGDLYAYLTHGSGFTVLLNRVGRTGANGFGYSDTGFAVTFVDGTDDVHAYQNFAPTFNVNGQLTGTWFSDGRNVNPASVTDASPRNANLDGQFLNTDPNGTWTLFLADMAGGGEPSTLVSWGIELVGGNPMSPLPTATSDTLERHPKSGVKTRISTLLANDFDPEGDPLTLYSVSPASAQGGTVAVSDGWVFFTPHPGFTNSDAFTYVIANTGGLQATGSVAIAISADRDPSQNIGMVEDLLNGSFRVVFRGILGRTYTIQYTESLETPDWQPLGTATSDSVGRIEFIDTLTPGSPTRFYRTTDP